MDTHFYRGVLKRWDEEKGFGFIKSANIKGHIFLHISALKRMSRRPVVGDIIDYQIHTDNDGKRRAVNARIEGVAAISTDSRSRKTRRKKGSHGLGKFAATVFLLAAGVAIYVRFSDRYTTVNHSVIRPISSSENARTEYESATSNFSCEGKVYCSQMTSCEEAMFYIHNCPGVKMDGDNDGIPCEGQWCRDW